MVVGVLVWELQLFGCRSLKDKRRIVKSLKDRLRNRFNVSVAETGHQDSLQRAEIAVSVVAGERAHADRILTRVDGMVEGEHEARIVDTYRVFY